MVFRSPWPNFLGFLYTTSKFRFLGDVKSFFVVFLQKKITKYCLCISWCYKIENGSIKVTSGFYLDLEDELTMYTFQTSPISLKLRISKKNDPLFLIIYMKTCWMDILLHVGSKNVMSGDRTFLVEFCVALTFTDR